mgnify:CR=1 FL=1
MQHNEILFREDIYLKHLATINGVNFTPREMDIIACRLNGREKRKEIAPFLSISENTVRTHIRNISLKIHNMRLLDFIDMSPVYSFIHLYYSCLHTYLTFEKSLKEISKFKHVGESNRLILYWKDETLKNVFLQRLVNHLKQAGIHAEIREHEAGDKRKNSENSSHALIFLLEKKNSPENDQNLPMNDFIELGDTKNYYLIFFEIVRKLLPLAQLDKIISKFNRYYDVSHNSHEMAYIHVPSEEKELAKKTIHNFYPFSNIHKTEQKNTSIYSEFIMPADSILLNREKLLTNIKEALNDERDIQTIALVGIGGAGKTTIARHYARNQKKSVVWEINAEDLMYSFEQLGFALSQTEEEVKFLMGLRITNDSKDREERLVQFVKERLRIQPNWFLIYDNVEKFTDIQKCFPFDPNSWGSGQIIITTRDRNIQNNSHISHIISVEELDINDSFTLFCKIMKNENFTNLEHPQKEQIVSFLKHIPPFPLDVTVAAYYLKTTGLTYEKYLNNLQSYNKDFEITQEDILKETAQYCKTRYNIITISLERLIKAHKDFEELLLLICLLDSQSIPKDILSFYKTETIVDSFIYHLRKYSLTICKTCKDFTPCPLINIHRSTQKISLVYLTKKLNLEKDHQTLKSIAEVLEKFVIRAICAEDFAMMKNLKNHLERFLSHKNLLTAAVKNSINIQLGTILYRLVNYEKAKDILKNILSELNKENDNQCLLVKAQTLMVLGIVYWELGNLNEAKSLLEQSISIFRKKTSKKNEGYTQAIAYLGNVYGELGKIPKAQKLLELSISYYTKSFPHNYFGRAWALTHLAIIYRNLGKYDKAKDLLEQSIIIYSKHIPNNPTIASAMTYLGEVNMRFGNFEKAKSLFMKSLQTYKKYFPENNAEVAWTLGHLGNLYSQQGNYKSSQRILEKSLSIHKKLFGENNSRTGWALTLLGNTYRHLEYFIQAETSLKKSLEISKKIYGENSFRTILVLSNLGYLYKDLKDYKKANQLLEKCLISYNKYYGKNHVEPAKIIEALGHLYALEGKLEQGKIFIYNALKIFKKNNHPHIYISLENLAELFLLKAKKARKEGKIQLTKDNMKQAKNYLIEAQKNIEGHLLKKSDIFFRIEAKLKKLSRHLNKAPLTIKEKQI